ncbi:HAD family phosphatase [Neobacillus mesonae]|uniref:HAD family hydrolase n=1 Tax=Neobacillus mesonae TaxID=1193713 RepID=UPI00203B2B6B|nr:HAD family phosphatase [Neobacillus mesonae]MCM3569867.1 HAD family phosphatase [Neobacillus mesonae]
MSNLAVIFDMDGVIVDTEPIYRRYNQEIFKKLDIQVDEITQRSYMGGTAKRKWSIIKEKYSLPQSVEELIALQRTIFSQKEWDYKQLLFPEVLLLLMSLKKHGIPTALASSSEMRRIQTVIDQCELRDYFNEIISGEDFERGKPDPQIFLHAAEKMGVSVSNCIVIEDSYNGVTAAKTANMYCIGVRHKQISMDLSQADRIVTSLAEVNVAKLKELFALRHF